MSDHKKIQTSRAVWDAIRETHSELKAFGSLSEPNGDPLGDLDECRMITVYGFEGCDHPFIGAKTTWRKNPDNPIDRVNERHTYWLCVAVDFE